MDKSRWHMLYADPRHGDKGDYVVVGPNGLRLQFHDKASAIAECQKRNGWKVDGREQTMAQQTRQHDEN